MLEHQRKQLIAGLEGMYWRLIDASAWDNVCLHEDTGRPHPHGIVSALGCLDSTSEVESAPGSPVGSGSRPLARLVSAAETDKASFPTGFEFSSLSVGGRQQEKEDEEKEEEKDVAGDVCCASEDFPLTLPWAEIDLSFLLPQLDDQTDTHDLQSPFLPSENFEQPMALGSMPTQTLMPSADEFIWPCEDWIYDFPAINEVSVDFSRLKDPNLERRKSSRSCWSLKLPEQSSRSKVPMISSSGARVA